MRDFKIFYLRICFMLFTSVQFSNAAIIPIGDPSITFACTATLHSLFVKKPHQDAFTQRSLANETILGVHNDRITFSLYEWGAPSTIFTFRQQRVQIVILHTASITFRVDASDGAWYFRCVFSADNKTIDILYSYMSVCTGFGSKVQRTTIGKVESYVRMSRMRNPSVEKVEGLQPATLYDQSIARDNPWGRIFYITTYTAGTKQRRLERLVFRTGFFKIGRVNEKVVLELSDFSDCLYILNLQDSLQALDLVDYINGTGQNEELDITPDLRLYLEHGLLTTYTENESEPQSSSSPDHDDLCALTLATRSGKHSRCDQNSSRNVRTRPNDDRE